MIAPVLGLRRRAVTLRRISAVACPENRRRVNTTPQNPGNVHATENAARHRFGDDRPRLPDRVWQFASTAPSAPTGDPDGASTSGTQRANGTKDCLRHQ